MAGPLQLTNTEFTYSGFHLTENGLTPGGSTTKDEWVECSRFLRYAEASIHFCYEPVACFKVTQLSPSETKSLRDSVIPSL